MRLTYNLGKYANCVVRFESDEWIQRAVGMQSQSHGYGISSGEAAHHVMVGGDSQSVACRRSHEIKLIETDAVARNSKDNFLIVNE